MYIYFYSFKNVKTPTAFKKFASIQVETFPQNFGAKTYSIKQFKRQQLNLQNLIFKNYSGIILPLRDACPPVQWVEHALSGKNRDEQFVRHVGQYTPKYSFHKPLGSIRNRFSFSGRVEACSTL